jgi:FXSXX-COOH protein
VKLARPTASVGEEIAVDSVTSVVSLDQVVPDTRAIPLEELATDSDVRRMVNRILGNMEGPSRLPVAAFNSAI